MSGFTSKKQAGKKQRIIKLHRKGGLNFPEVRFFKV
jgi:hypothetical protein